MSVLALKTQKFDFSAPIRPILLQLEFVGLWPPGDGSYKLNFYTFYAIFILTIIFGGHFFFQTVTLFFVYDTIETFASNIFLTMTDIMIMLKVYNFIKHTKTLKKWLQLLKEDAFQPKDDRQIQIIKPTVDLWKTTYKFFFVLVCLAASVWSIVPFLNKAAEDKELPFPVWLPYDHTVSPFYELSYAHELFGLWFMGMTNVNFDNLIFACLTYVAAQCELLSDNLRNMLKCATSQHEPLVHKGIIDCIKQHKELLRYTNLLYHAQKLKQNLTLV